MYVYLSYVRGREGREGGGACALAKQSHFRGALLGCFRGCEGPAAGAWRRRRHGMLGVSVCATSTRVLARARTPLRPLAKIRLDKGGGAEWAAAPFENLVCVRLFA